MKSRQTAKARKAAEAAKAKKAAQARKILTVGVGIGLLFGYMPACRAAKFNPIHALRSE